MSLSGSLLPRRETLHLVRDEGSWGGGGGHVAVHLGEG